MAFTFDQKLCENVRKVVSKKIAKVYEDVNRALSNLDPNDDADVLWEPLTVEEKEEDITRYIVRFVPSLYAKTDSKVSGVISKKNFEIPRKEVSGDTIILKACAKSRKAS